MSEAMKYKLPPLPEPTALGMDFDKGWDGIRAYGYTEDDMQAYAIAAIEAQGVPDGVVLQIDAAVTQAQKLISNWNEWYGMHGDNAPIPPGGIVKAQEMLSVAKSLLAAAPPAPQAKPQPLTSDQKWDMWTAATIEQPSARGCYFRGVEDAEHAHGITKE